MKIRLIDLVACYSLKLALCLALLLPNSRVQGYHDPVVMLAEGKLGIYDATSGAVITNSGRAVSGAIPAVRFVHIPFTTEFLAQLSFPRTRESRECFNW